jgi:hypothetical protein
MYNSFQEHFRNNQVNFDQKNKGEIRKSKTVKKDM